MNRAYAERELLAIVDEITAQDCFTREQIISALKSPSVHVAILCRLLEDRELEARR
jgi:hypothetical protein